MDKGYVNHDDCDACGTSGDLIMCDRCPASFHFSCLAPPQDQKQLEKLRGDWFCNRCQHASGEIPPLPSGNTLLKVLAYVGRSNPKEFAPPAYVKKRALTRHTRDPPAGAIGTEDVGNGAALAPGLVQEHVCARCGSAGTTATLVTCAYPGCGLSYHLYCAEPELLVKPPLWQCSRHDEVMVSQDLLPSVAFSLDFFPRTSPASSTQPSKSAAARSLLAAAGAENDGPADGGTVYDDEELPLHERLAVLQQRQQALLMHALPPSVRPSFQASADAAASATALSQLTPLFTQFLAWQRLLEIQSQVAQIQQSAGMSSVVGVPVPHEAVVGAVPAKAFAGIVPDAPMVGANLYGMGPEPGLDPSKRGLGNEGPSGLAPPAKRARTENGTTTISNQQQQQTSAMHRVSGQHQPISRMDSRVETPDSNAVPQASEELMKTAERQYALSHTVLAVLSQNYANEETLADFRDAFGNVFIVIHRPKVTLGRRAAEEVLPADTQHIDLRVVSSDVRFLSRNHGIIERDDNNRWWFRITGRNGQKINNKLYKDAGRPIELFEGDELKFGDQYLRFHLPGEPLSNGVPL